LTIRTSRVTKRVVAAVATAALGATLLALPTSPVSAALQPVTTDRITGVTRYQTSENAASANNSKNTATDLILASGANFPDALAAVGLAETEDASIILLPADGTMSASTIAVAAAATNVFIVGGTNSLPSTVELTLTTSVALGGAGQTSADIARVSGNERYATAALVATRFGASNVAAFQTKKTAILVSGENFADAVSASMLVAGAKGSTELSGHPILLTKQNSLPSVTEVALINLGVTQVVIVGGTAAVSEQVEASVKALNPMMSVVRIAGGDRCETASKVADLAVKSVATGGFGYSNELVFLAELGNAGGGADALAAGQLVATNNAVLLCTNGGVLPASSTDWLTNNRSGTTTMVTAMGGETAIPATTLSSAKEAAGGTSTALSATIAARQGQLSAVVTFSEAVTETSAEAAATYTLIKASDGTALTGTGTMVKTVATDTTGQLVAVTWAGSYAMQVNDTVRIVGSKVSTSDGRKVPVTETNVVVDSTAPTATMSSLIPAAGLASITITFDEAVLVKASTLVAGDITVNGVANADPFTIVATKLDATTTTGALAGVVDTVAITKLVITESTNGVFDNGDKVSLLANKFKDLAGNNLGATSAVLVEDAVAPSISGSSTVTSAGTSKASLVLDGKILLTSDAAGSAGNLPVVTYTAAGASTVLSATYAANNLQIVLGTDGSSASLTTVAELVAKINAQTVPFTASALVSTATVTDEQGTTALPFTGGLTSFTTVTSFSEAIGTAPTSAFTWDGDGSGAANCAATTTLTVIAGGVVTSTFTSAKTECDIAIGTSTLTVSAGVLDVAGNGNSSTAAALVVSG
jgi:putative cell wall-binding protein